MVLGILRSPNHVPWRFENTFKCPRGFLRKELLVVVVLEGDDIWEVFEVFFWGGGWK